MTNTKSLKDYVKKIISTTGYTIKKLDIPKHPQQLKQVSAQHFFELYFSLIDPKDFFFIQLGANDGSFVDPLFPYITKYSLPGILVEPQKDVFERLKNNYKSQKQVQFANVAISTENGERTLYTITDSLKEKSGLFNRMTGIASFDKSLLVKSLKYEFLKKEWHDKMERAEDFIEETIVPTTTFQNLMDKFEVRKVDYIQMDCEGFDYEIIKMIDLNSLKPKVINFESTHLSPRDRVECEEMFEHNGYQIFRHRFDTCAFRT